MGFPTCFYVPNGVAIGQALQANAWRRQWQATPVLLPRKSHGWRNLVGCSPWGCCKSDATERLHFHFSLSHNGEGNGNPLQCSCLENPRDGRAWWAAVYGVAQSRTWLKRLSSSSSSSNRQMLQASRISKCFVFVYKTSCCLKYHCLKHIVKHEL